MPRASIRLRKPQTSSAVISGGRTEPVIAALLLRVAPLEAAENRALHRADIAVLAQREWLGILDCGLGEHSWSRPTMRPRRRWTRNGWHMYTSPARPVAWARTRRNVAAGSSRATSPFQTPRSPNGARTRGTSR